WLDITKKQAAIVVTLENNFIKRRFQIDSNSRNGLGYAEKPGLSLSRIFRTGMTVHGHTVRPFSHDGVFLRAALSSK
ncbi:hypothetical protein Q4595_28230, partial [Wenyingzhuangia sp. 1_MG-2023]|nr:hypothetical protein [Wenyingzhuangia sp. 1_MG-2023]